ncbi:MAG: shikimate dehydrogenase [Candidatus Eremiobacteraeota bacterium]|nr:shikimate dehydrogenase [Candidatus Eremiobacteraeota bacterium]
MEQELLGLLGYPLGHTVSPILHRVAGESFGMDIVYLPFEVKGHCLGDALKGLQVLGFTGCNVTIPYKEEILRFVDEKSDVVELLGAANTLSFRGGRVIADNTDWEGFLSAWRDAGLCEIEGKSAVVLGAGGAADAVVYALVESGVKSVMVFNRNRDRALELIEKFKDKYPHIEGNAYSLNNHPKFANLLKSTDILINTIPVGMFPDTDRMPVKIPKKINPNLNFFDLIYNPGETMLMSQLKARGIKVSGGLGMLVHQAAFAFKKWFGLLPDAGKMHEAACKQLE